MARPEPHGATGGDVLAGIVSGLRKGLGDYLVAVVLFGSRARGEAYEGSDWDVLVIARRLPKRTLERAFLPSTTPATTWQNVWSF